jgi:hypothetical protein
MELHGWNIQIIPKLGFKLERAFQQIALYCQSCLTSFFQHCGMYKL